MNTLGMRIKRYRMAKQLSQQALATECGWASQSRIGNYEKGTREPNLGDLEKIAKALGLTLSDLVAGGDQSNVEGAHAAVHQHSKVQEDASGQWGMLGGVTTARERSATRQAAVPLAANVRAVNAGFFESQAFTPTYGAGYLDIHSEDATAYGLRILGDSMHPRLKNGELVLVEPNRPYASGDEVIVWIKDGKAMIREFIYQRDGLLRLDSINAGNAPLHIAQDEVESIHLVVGILKPVRFINMFQGS